MIYAIIDIGSNTIRMAVYNVQDVKFEMLIKKKYTVGLAAYIDDRRMSQAGIDKACSVLHKFKGFLENFKIDNIVAFATAALRNIDNSVTAVAEISQRTGLAIRVISGEEEAKFDFISSTKSIGSNKGIIVDIGGASTEIVIYKNNTIEQCVSISLGSLMMYKQNVAGIIPSSQEAEEIRRLAKNELAKLKFLKCDGFLICGIGGTFKALWQLNCHMLTNNSDSKVIVREELGGILAEFLNDRHSLEQSLEILIDAVPERVKTVIPGMLIAAVIVDYFNSGNIIYSDSGVREGYLYNIIMDK